MSLAEYYISSEILREILEGIHFLHNLKPKPIIHRDLKPSNLLITHGFNDRFVKLADFGLAVVLKCDDQTHTQCMATEEYRALEVLEGTAYDTKADIYSLGIITQQLFDFYLFASTRIHSSDLKTEYKYLIESIAQMITKIKSETQL